MQSQRTDAFAPCKRLFTLLHYYRVAPAASEAAKLITSREEPVSVLNDGFDDRDHMHGGGGCHLSQRPARKCTEFTRFPGQPIGSLVWLRAIP